MKRWVVLGCGLPLVLIGVGGWMGMRALRGVAAEPTRYSVAQLGDVEVKVTETGTIEPLKKVEVKSKVAGRVARLQVDAGSRVRSGQRLAETDADASNSQGDR